MLILVINIGSSSLKCGVFDLARKDCRIFKAEYSDFANGQARLRCRSGGEKGEYSECTETLDGIPDALRQLPRLLRRYGVADFVAIGHRVVHGGERFHAATFVDDAVLRELQACENLAPLHNPPAIAGIRLCRELWPALPQVAVFDTAFHQDMPEYASTYAVPRAWRELGLRRYGFHGTSHHYVALRSAEALGRPLDSLRIISCHLGNGASICAISHGRSVDTSMGMTPLEGLVMGTRSGDVDPGLFPFLARQLGLDALAVETALQHDSGLKALAGTRDWREIETRASGGDPAAQLAIGVYVYRVRKYIGAYAAAMGGIDALVFTGGIGENAPDLRRRVCERLEFLGLALDEAHNRAPLLDDFAAPQIQSIDSRVRVLVTRANEQYMIAREVEHLLSHAHRQAAPCRIPVAVSARHAHLSQAAVEALFGAGYQLQPERSLTQPQSFAAAETVDLLGPKGGFTKVRVLGPTRAATQIEVSRTDTFMLGIDAPLRNSGKLENTPEVTLRGPAGDYRTTGLIVAARHIHMSPADGDRLGLRDGDLVDMRLGAGGREVAFANTLIRIKEGYVTEMHIDTDEANAAGITFCTEGELIMNNDTPHVDLAALKIPLH